MVKPSRGFILSVAGAIAWLALSALLARLWVRQAALSLPLGYTVWVWQVSPCFRLPDVRHVSLQFPVPGAAGSGQWFLPPAGYRSGLRPE